MYKATTPTLKLKFPNAIDMTEATNVYVTFSKTDYTVILTKESSDLEIKKNEIDIFLDQTETKDFPDEVLIQVNWLYEDNYGVKRACSNIVKIDAKVNLIKGVLPNVNANNDN